MSIDRTLARLLLQHNIPSNAFSTLQLYSHGYNAASTLAGEFFLFMESLPWLIADSSKDFIRWQLGDASWERLISICIIVHDNYLRIQVYHQATLHDNTVICTIDQLRAFQQSVLSLTANYYALSLVR